MKKILILLVCCIVCPLLHAQTVLTARTNTFHFRISAAINPKTTTGEKKGSTMDSQKPTLTLVVPAQVSMADYELNGKVTDNEGVIEILVNDKEIGFKHQTGEFTHTLHLKVGKNNIVVVAKDAAGNIETVTYPIIYQPERSLETNKEEAIVGSAVSANNFMLVFACQNYTNNPDISDLQQPVQDAQNVISTLTTLYDFDQKRVILKKNPTRSQIIEVMDSLMTILMENDNLLIFYAGHAHYDQDLKKGYWLPVDAKLHSRANWVSNDDLKGYISNFKTKHTLLIADACFSGSILRDISQEIKKASLDIRKLYGMPSRKAMTSGTMKPVPDNSVFIKYLIKNLTNNTEQFITASTLFNSLRETVIKNSPNFQVPQYGDIHEAGDEGGEFIFIKKQ